MENDSIKVNMMSERKLATVRVIDGISPISGADRIEVASVGGWNVVVQKDQFKVGDLAIYLEIDSWVPIILAPFLAGDKEHTFNGVIGERLRTKKLKGVISQGLLIGMWPIAHGHYDDAEENSNLTELLGIQLYEKPVPACLAGMAKGNFPSFIPKTDQERIQNIRGKYQAWIDNDVRWEITEKLDGSSMTVYQYKGVFGVCSRNLDLKETEGNTFWQVARSNNVENNILHHDPYWNFAIQGELCGPGIQGNQYGLTKPEFFVYDIFDIEKQEYLLPEQRRILCSKLKLAHVPVVFIMPERRDTVEQLLGAADGMSTINSSNREGLVFKSETNDTDSFKVISNKWLLKND